MTVSLFDALTRQQVYLEGYKDGLDGELDDLFDNAQEEVLAALVAANFSRLNELTRKELNALIRRINKLQLRRNDAFRAKVLKELRMFAQDNVVLTRQIFEHVENKTVEEAYEAKDGLPLLGLLALRRNRQGRARLWALVSNEIDPASGLTARKAINNFVSYVSRNISDILRQGYANGWTTTETIRAIFGTRSNRFNDGLLARMRRAGSSMLHTVVQHVSSVTQAAVSSVFYKLYEWVSVIDLATTAICRSRDGNVYRYRKGPLPPAHYRCRSTTVPVKQGKTYQQLTYHAWLSQQPRSFVDDVVGVRVGRGLRAGRVSATELGRFKTYRPLTRSDFLGKFTVIIAA